jgi:hypothetical protein
VDLEAVLRELLVAYRNDIMQNRNGSLKFVTRIKQVIKEFDLEYGLNEQPADIEDVRQWME